jgi:adenine-specific DNA-methyltransferase
VGDNKGYISGLLREGKNSFSNDYDFLNISIPAYRVFESEDKAKAQSKFGVDDSFKSMSTQLPKEVGMTETGNKEMSLLFDKVIFSFPKPSSLIKHFLKGIKIQRNDIVLDFFSGSSTTAHAVMQINAEDGGNRKFIMVQWPEEVKENSEAFKFLSELKKPTNICEIGKERIRRAGEKIKQELIEKQAGKLNLEEDSIDPEKLDIGFKVFRVADTNIRWLKDQTIPRELMEGMVSDKDHLDFTPGFKDIDIVYEILLRHRDIPLSSSIEVLSDIGPRTYSIASTIVVCLEEEITSEIVDKLAALEPKPSKIIFRDSAFDDDISLKLNTLKRLDFQLKRFNEAKDQTYRVEFI